MLGLAMMDVLDRRVVAEGHDLDPLQPHNAPGFRPSPVVADAHPNDGVKDAPYFEALVADVEIALFEMLEASIGQMLGMPGQVDLAVASDDPPVALDEDRGVVVPDLALLLGQLGIAEIEAHTQLLRQVEQRPGL